MNTGIYEFKNEEAAQSALEILANLCYQNTKAKVIESKLFILADSRSLDHILGSIIGNDFISFNEVSEEEYKNQYTLEELEQIIEGYSCSKCCMDLMDCCCEGE